MAFSLGSIFAELGLHTTSFDAGINRAMGSLSKFGQKATAIGRTLSLAVTTPLLGAGVGAIKMAADFETAMLEVRKVTDVDVAEKIRESIDEMSQRIPLSQNALAGLAADAARFGIRGVENISAFTEAVAKMAEATDLSEQTAGIALAKISQQTRISAKEVENLGSAINELGNNFATSESEIVDAMLRSSAAAANFGLAANEIAALNAQMNSMSESAERAGTRFRTLIEQLLDPSKLHDIAGAIGMTAEAFEEVRKRSPREALMLLVEAMAEGGKEADNLRMTLESTALGALTALSQNLGETRKALKISSDAFTDGTSLTKEFETAVESFNSQWELMMNSLRDAAIIIGNDLMPTALDMIGVVKEGVKWFKSLSKETRLTGITIAGVAAVVGPVLVAIGALSAAIAAISAPVLAIVGVVAAASTLIITNWEKIRSYFTTGPGGRIFDRFAKRVSETWRMLKEGWQAFTSQLGDVDVIAIALEAVVTTVSIAALAIINSLNTVIAILSFEWKKAWESASKIVTDTVGVLADSVSRHSIRMGKSVEDALMGPPESGVGKMMKELAEDLIKTQEEADKLNKELGGGSGTAGLINTLEAKLEDLKKQKNAAFSVEAIADFNAEIRKTEKELERLENAFKFDFSAVGKMDRLELSLDSQDFQDQLKKGMNAFARKKGPTIKLDLDREGLAVVRLLGTEMDVLQERARKAEEDVARLTSIFEMHSPEVQNAVNRWAALRNEMENYNLSISQAGFIADQAGSLVTGFFDAMANRREDMADLERQILRLQEQKKKTFEPSEIKEFNKKIAELRGEMMKTSKLGGVFERFGKSIKNTLKGIIEQLAQAAIKALVFKVVLTALTGGVGGAVGFGNIFKGMLFGGGIPGLARGGTVPPGFPNDTYPALLTSGETVIPDPMPLDDMGGTGRVIETNIFLDGDLIYRNQKEVEYKKNR